MKKRVKIITMVLVLALVLTLSVAFAYWAGTVNNPTDQNQNGVTANISTAAQQNTTLAVVDQTTPTSDKLVPSTVTPGAGETAKLTYTYEVTWSVPQGSFNGTLSVNVTNIKVDGAATNAGLIHVTVASGAGAITTGTPVTVTVEVTMDEPADQTQYNAVVDKPITFDLGFSVVAN